MHQEIQGIYQLFQDSTHHYLLSVIQYAVYSIACDNVVCSQSMYKTSKINLITVCGSISGFCKIQIFFCLFLWFVSFNFLLIFIFYFVIMVIKCTRSIWKMKKYLTFILLSEQIALVITCFIHELHFITTMLTNSCSSCLILISNCYLATT